MFTFRTFGPTEYLKANFCTTSVPTSTVRFHYPMVENKTFPASSPPLVTWGWNNCCSPP